jgi:hypothetical protein
MQLCRIVYYPLAALCVSSDIFSHHQEHLNCITAFGITHVCRCWLVSWESWNCLVPILLILSIVCVCVCNLRYQTCNVHAPYCHLWPVRLYNIFPHYLINGTIFQRTLVNMWTVFGFSLQFFVWSVSYSKKNLSRCHTCRWVFMERPRYSSQIFEKY